MSIFRAGAYSAVATAARLLAGLVIVKLVALFAGPEGVGKMGQFMSIMSLLSVLAGGGVASGITKYVAQYREAPVRMHSLIGSGLTFSFCASLIVGVFALAFSHSLTVWLLGDERYESLIWILAVAQALIALHNFLVAVINGFMDVRRVAMVHVGGAVLGVGVTAWLSWQFQLYGALLALVVGQAALLVLSAPMLLRAPYFEVAFLRPRMDGVMLRQLLGYSVMTLTSALLPPLVNIWVRNHLAAQFEWEQVGYWQAVSKVSEAYLLFITMTISTYYLPKLSSISEGRAFRMELRKAAMVILPTVAVLALAIYATREWVLELLFTRKFLAGAYLFAPQLVGDVIKVAAFLQSYVMLAKALTKAFIVSEVVFGLTYVGWVYFFVERYGLIGVTYAFAVNYMFYWCYTYVVARWYVNRMP